MLKQKPILQLHKRIVSLHIQYSYITEYFSCKKDPIMFTRRPEDETVPRVCSFPPYELCLS